MSISKNTQNANTNIPLDLKKASDEQVKSLYQEIKKSLGGFSMYCLVEADTMISNFISQVHTSEIERKWNVKITNNNEIHSNNDRKSYDVRIEEYIDLANEIKDKVPSFTPFCVVGFKEEDEKEVLEAIQANKKEGVIFVPFKFLEKLYEEYQNRFNNNSNNSKPSLNPEKVESSEDSPKPEDKEEKSFILNLNPIRTS